MPQMRRLQSVYLLASLAGLICTLMLGAHHVVGQTGTCNEKYSLLNPTRRCAQSLPQGEWNYETLRDMLRQKKDELKSAGAVNHLSIYFQDLDHGPRFGIGEYDKFLPASLMKVPVLIFFLHAADLDRSILDRTLTYTGTLDVSDNVGTPEETILPDTPYSIRDMLTKMIKYSDNRSYLVLLREMSALSEDTAYYTFRDLDVLNLMVESDETYISISSYAKLFSVLYNMGYLSKDMSQYALKLLSETTFTEGIVAGVPAGTRVAHKFGYTNVDGGQLHDCGIVYHPETAYILCVLTSGPDQDKANGAIIDISRMVFDAVSAPGFDNLLHKSQKSS